MTKITNLGQSIVAASVLCAITYSTAAQSATIIDKHLQPATSNKVQTVKAAKKSGVKKTEAKLQHIRVNGDNLFELAYRLESLDFDVLEGSIEKQQFEVIVDQAQLKQLQKYHDIRLHILAKGQPYASLPDAMPVDTVDLKSTKLAPPSGYKNLAQVMQELNAIAALNPTIAEVVDITARYNQPTTIGGHHMYAIKISDNVQVNEDEPNVLVVSNHHVRELVTPVIALNAARNLVQQYGSNSEVTNAVNNNEIWIAANWNPDGYVHVFEVDNMWRKNRRVMSNGVGVDLNRNYPIGWNTSCSGSTSHSSQTYKGPSEGSEVETQTMMAWADDRRFTKVIDFHSSGREVLWDYHPSCATHPFDDHQKEEGKVISADAGYDRWRSATALGENFQWHLNKGANAYLVETHSSFQPTYESARQEAQQLWPALLNYFNRAIPVLGHIKDENGAVLQGVDVRVLNKTYPFDDTNLSAQNGRYHVHLPQGDYTLHYSKPGYTSVTHNVTVSAGNSTTLNVTLSTGPADSVTELTNKTAVANLSGVQSQQQFFKLNVPQTATSLNFTLSGGTGDADLYVQKDAKPTLSDWECRPYVGGNNESCDVTPSAGDWYAMLVGYSQFSGANLVASYDEGSIGNDTLNETDLSASKGQQLKFSVDVPAGRSKVNVYLSGGSGDGDLYVKFGAEPTTSNYDCRSWVYGNNETCSVTRTGDKAYIMINAYADFSGASLSASSN